MMIQRVIIHSHAGAKVTTYDVAVSLAEQYRDLVDELWAFLEKKASAQDKEWEESKHPRRDDGKFGHGAGLPAKPEPFMGEPDDPGKPTSAKATVAKHALHELLSSGHPFSLEELGKIMGHANLTTLASWISMFRTGKTIGSLTPLNIVKNKDGTYQVMKGERPAPPIAKPKPPEPPVAAPKPPVAAPAPAPKPPTPPGAPTAVKGFPKWEPQTNAKKAAVLAMANGYASHVDFGKLSPKVFNAHMESLSAHLEEFPELRKTQDFAGSMQVYLKRDVAQRRESMKQQLLSRSSSYYDQDTPEGRENLERMLKRTVRSQKAPSKTWAFASRNAGKAGVAFNEKFGVARNEEALHLSLKRSAYVAWDAPSGAVGFHPPGCDTVKSIMDHEYGHQLDFMLNLSKHPEVEQLRRDANYGAAVSGYAKKNMAEFIAESWAESMNNPHPRRHAEAIAKIVRSEYAKKFPKP